MCWTRYVRRGKGMHHVEGHKESKTQPGGTAGGYKAD